MVATSLPCLAAGRVSRVNIDDLRPDQFVIGQRYVDAKSRLIGKMSKHEREKYLESRPIPAIRGFDGQSYMLDHHHLARAVAEAGYGHVYVRIIHDWSHEGLSKSEFWDRMKREGFVYLRDENNRLRRVEDLYQNIEDLKDDPYRSLAGAVRDAGGFRKTKTPFTEFIWANYFRKKISRDVLKNHWKKALKIAHALAEAPDANDLPGYRGQTCRDLFAK